MTRRRPRRKADTRHCAKTDLALHFQLQNSIAICSSIRVARTRICPKRELLESRMCKAESRSKRVLTMTSTS